MLFKNVLFDNYYVQTLCNTFVVLMDYLCVGSPIYGITIAVKQSGGNCLFLLNGVPFMDSCNIRYPCLCENIATPSKCDYFYRYKKAALLQEDNYHTQNIIFCTELSSLCFFLKIMLDRIPFSAQFISIFELSIHT